MVREKTNNDKSEIAWTGKSTVEKEGNRENKCLKEGKESEEERRQKHVRGKKHEDKLG